MQLRRVWFFGILVCILGVSPLVAANWPQFRGPNGAGVSHDKGIPIQFTPQDGVLWKTPIPGTGHSSPIVWGDRIFLQSASADGKERMLLCLNATDGQIIWSRNAAGARTRTHNKNTLASCTPATDGERVYCPFWDGRKISLTAFDFQGNQVWTHDLGDFASQHGAGTSPIVYQGRVYYPNDQDGQSSLMALDAKTGDTVWQAPRRAFRACYSAPFILEKPGTPPELVVVSTAGFTAYHPQTGEVVWNWDWDKNRVASDKPLRTVGTPIHSHGLVFASSGDGDGSRHAIAVRTDAKGDVTSTHLAWQVRKMFPYVPTMLVNGDHLFFVNDKGIAGCRAVKTGEEVWTERVCAEVSASPVLIDSKIYIISEDGDVHVLDATPQFKILGKSSLGEGVLASPAVANNRLYIRGKAHLYCVGRASTR